MPAVFGQNIDNHKLFCFLEIRDCMIEQYITWVALFGNLTKNWFGAKQRQISR